MRVSTGEAVNLIGELTGHEQLVPSLVPRQRRESAAARQPHGLDVRLSCQSLFSKPVSIEHVGDSLSESLFLMRRHKVPKVW